MIAIRFSLTEHSRYNPYINANDLPTRQIQLGEAKTPQLGGLDSSLVRLRKLECFDYNDCEQCNANNSKENILVGDGFLHLANGTVMY